MTGIPWESVTPGYWWALDAEIENGGTVPGIERIVDVRDAGRWPYIGMHGADVKKHIVDWGGPEFECKPEEYIFLAPVAPRVSVDFHELA